MSYRRGSLPRDVYNGRDVGDRLRRLENHRPSKAKSKVGDWYLTMDPDTGDLVAVHRPSGARRVLAALDSPNGALPDEHEDRQDQVPGG